MLPDLEGPDYPIALSYLHEWIYELHGRSGVGMSGAAPLTYTTIEAWARLREVDVSPHEVSALIQLDAALMHRDSPDESPPPIRLDAWPVKRTE